MQKRVLGENGKFTNFKGKRDLKKIVPEAQKIKERKDAEVIGDKHGFDVSNPVEGVLSEKDIELLKDGKLNLMGVVSLANNRKIEIPEGMEDKEDIIAFLLKEEGEGSSELSKDDAHAIGKMSIPEMRAYAKENKIQIPADKKKSADIKEFLLAQGQSVEDAL